MRSTRPFVPPTALKYIEDLERKQGILVKLLEMAYADKAAARAAIGELMIRRDLDESATADLRELTQKHLYQMPDPHLGVEDVPYWRDPEKAEGLPYERHAIPDPA